MSSDDPVRDDCCAPAPDPRIASHFDSLTRERTAGGVLPPMQPISRTLLSLLGDVDEVRPSVLELGCGSGALAEALLSAGAIRFDGIDLSPMSLAAAGRRLDAAGFTGTSTLTVGDAAHATLAAHDWVVMDRVICCYPDWQVLLDNALGAARSRLAFSVPTSRGLRGAMNRVWWGLEAWWTSVRPGPCRGYVHSLDRIESRLAAAGFKRLHNRTGLMWYAAVWERCSGDWRPGEA